MTSLTEFNLTLLVVDDEPDILSAIQRLFRRRYHVLTAQSTREAELIIATEPVHVILCDQRLPRQTGVEFFSKIRHEHPDIVRVLFTGYTNIDSVIDAINEGAVYRYINKPWNPAELKLFIDQAFEHYTSQRERQMLHEQLRRSHDELEQSNQRLTQMNEQLKQLDEVRRVFMEVISHELNTPIAIITGYTYLLRRELESQVDSTAAKSLDRIESSAKRLKRISDRIFQMLSEDSPEHALMRGPVNLRQLAASVYEQVEPFLLKRRQRLSSNIEDGSETIEADFEKLQDALVHLIMNAIKFSQDQQTIHLTIQTNPARRDELLLRVEDHGVGIPARDVPQIFNAFFSTFNTANHSSGEYEFNKRGIGLGLSLARKFVHMHGGRIEASSEEGKGSVFTITLPKRAPRQALSAER